MRQAALSVLVLVFLASVQSDLAAQRQPPPQRPDGTARRDQRFEGLLKVGDAAPDFTLSYKGSDETFTLSRFKGDKPVALVFGSYT